MNKLGRSRRVTVTVSNFMLALAGSDLVAALLNSLVQTHAARFGLSSVQAPLVLRRLQLRASVLKRAMQDAGVAWLFAAIEKAIEATYEPVPKARKQSAASPGRGRRGMRPR